MAVIVALVGSGQEINTGEAGLGEWGRALARRFRHWSVLASPNVLTNDLNRGSDRLFETPPGEMNVVKDAATHLDVALRSYKAQAVSDFVAHLLARQMERARLTLAACTKFPFRMTRDFATARD